MTNETTARTPPYASYTSFSNFLEHLREHPPLPPRIDKSVMSHLNYGTQQAVVAAFESLGLVNKDSVPTARLERLVDAKENQRASVISEAVKHGYPYFFTNGFDLSRATPDQFREAIKSQGQGLKGSTIDKAISFFIAAATAGGIKLSPHLTKRKQIGRRASGAANGAAETTTRNTKAKRPKPKPNRTNGSGHGAENKGGVPTGMVDQLLKKFPDFDPKWDEKLKAKWFEGFERLMGSAGVKERS